MISNNKLACPLDCYDACEAVYANSKFRPSKEHFVTSSKLCTNFARLVSQKNIALPKCDGDIIFLDYAKSILSRKLKTSNPDKVLFYKGSGNMGVMQNSTKLFFEKFGATFANGSLCDINGARGIEKDRESVVNPPLENLIKSDIIIVWGRNLTITSPHIYNLIKNKEFITVDPIKTEIAKKSSLHLQITPKSDYLLALLFTRFAYLEDFDDNEFMKSYTSNSSIFLDLAKEKSINEYLKECDISLKDIGDFFHLLKDKKVSVLIGLGVQKYFEGASILRCIEGFCATLGLYNKDIGGVWYLSDSMFGYENPFKIEPKNITPISSAFEKEYDLIFIQGANPVISAPNKNEVIKSLKNSYVVYFGTTLNETSQYADLIIPSKLFYEKNDVRLSYGHDEVVFSSKQKEVNIRISEYELADFLMQEFSFKKMEEESFYLNKFKKKLNCSKKVDEFIFIDSIEIKSLEREKNQFFLISSKSKNTINSQFDADNHIYIHSQNGYKDLQEVKVRSAYGEAVFIVKVSDDIREDSVLIYTGAKELNRLTSSKPSQYADGTIYSEVVVTIDI